jgi:hypothetical protein
MKFEETKMLEAFSLAESENTRISEAVMAFAKPVAKDKTVFEPRLVDTAIKNEVKKIAGDMVSTILAAKAASERGGNDKDVIDCLG